MRQPGQRPQLAAKRQHRSAAGRRWAAGQGRRFLAGAALLAHAWPAAAPALRTGQCRSAGWAGHLSARQVSAVAWATQSCASSTCPPQRMRRNSQWPSAAACRGRGRGARASCSPGRLPCKLLGSRGSAPRRVRAPAPAFHRAVQIASQRRQLRRGLHRLPAGPKVELQGGRAAAARRQPAQEGGGALARRAGRRHVTHKLDGGVERGAGAGQQAAQGGADQRQHGHAAGVWYEGGAQKGTLSALGAGNSGGVRGGSKGVAGGSRSCGSGSDSKQQAGRRRPPAALTAPAGRTDQARAQGPPGAGPAGVVRAFALAVACRLRRGGRGEQAAVGGRRRRRRRWQQRHSAFGFLRVKCNCTTSRRAFRSSAELRKGLRWSQRAGWRSPCTCSPGVAVITEW